MVFGRRRNWADGENSNHKSLGAIVRPGIKFGKLPRVDCQTLMPKVIVKTAEWAVKSRDGNPSCCAYLTRNGLADRRKRWSREISLKFSGCIHEEISSAPEFGRPRLPLCPSAVLSIQPIMFAVET